MTSYRNKKLSLREHQEFYCSLPYSYAEGGFFF
jgi:uncharacterized protein YggL (DUF469 family)